jgi:hypothetical protein
VAEQQRLIWEQARQLDELRLAQFACAKLAGMVQGAVSIGLPALVSGESGAFDSRIFLEQQFRVMTGFALVLHTVSGKPGAVEEILRLRDRSRAVLTTLDDLQDLLLHHQESSDGPTPTFQSARDSAFALCDAIAEYADLVKLDRSRIAKVKEVVLQVFDGVENMNQVGKPSSE